MDAGAAPQAAGAGPGPSASEDRLTTDQDAARALSLMPEAVVCRRDDAAFFFRKARRDPMRMHPVRRLAVISRAAFRPFAG